MQLGDSQRRCEACLGSRFEPCFEKDGQRYERCMECGVERIEPGPTDAELERIYGSEGYVAWGLSSDGDAVRALKHATFRRVIAAAGALAAGAPVLDCGAGTGFLMDVAARAGYEPYGIEFSPIGAASIAARFGADRVWQGQLEDARFARLVPPRFAAIFMCDFIEHVRDPGRVLRTAAQWLPPGAPLVITTPRVGSWTQRAMGAAWSHYKTEHLYYFTAAGLQTLLARAGFVNVRSGPLWKAMSLEYVRHYFGVYDHPVLSPVARMLGWLPGAIRNRHLPLLMGEMLVVARRDTGAGPQPRGSAGALA